MRTPIHRRNRCGSVSTLAIVALLLMSSASAQAAGEIDDEGFVQAVIDGRRLAREAYERAGQVDRVDAAEASERREREVAERGTGGAGLSSDATETGGSPANAVHPDDRFPWTYVILGSIALGSLLYIRLRRNG